MGTKVEQHIKDEEAKRLGRLLAEVGITNHAAFARDCGLPGGKSMLSQHLAATRPISLECAVAYALGLGRPLADISPRLAGIIDLLPDVRKTKAATPIQEKHADSTTGPRVAALMTAIAGLAQEDVAMLHAIAERLADSPKRGA